MKQAILVVVLIAVVGLIVAVVYRAPQQNESAQQSTTTTTSTATSTDTTIQTESLTASTTKATQKTMQATITTNKGVITLELYADKTPNTVANFTKLAQAGFYNTTKFHRVIDGFMIQGGDPLTKDDTKQSMWGTGGPGYKFADEFVPGLSNVTGTISMANAGPNTNGSQFFINVADNTFLDGKHSVFGRVTGGMDVVTAISEVERSQRDVPVDPVVLESVVITQ
jgi:cyclophilin family peptidyl-prolyl cis-trans isomerase